GTGRDYLGSPAVPLIDNNRPAIYLRGSHEPGSTTQTGSVEGSGSVRGWWGRACRIRYPSSARSREQAASAPAYGRGANARRGGRSLQGQLEGIDRNGSHDRDPFLHLPGRGPADHDASDPDRWTDVRSRSSVRLEH